MEIIKSQEQSDKTELKEKLKNILNGSLLDNKFQKTPINTEQYKNEKKEELKTEITPVKKHSSIRKSNSDNINKFIDFQIQKKLDDYSLVNYILKDNLNSIKENIESIGNISNKNDLTSSIKNNSNYSQNNNSIFGNKNNSNYSFKFINITKNNPVFNLNKKTTNQSSYKDSNYNQNSLYNSNREEITNQKFDEISNSKNISNNSDENKVIKNNVNNYNSLSNSIAEQNGDKIDVRSKNVNSPNTSNKISNIQLNSSNSSSDEKNINNQSATRHNEQNNNDTAVKNNARNLKTENINSSLKINANTETAVNIRDNKDSKIISLNTQNPSSIQSSEENNKNSILNIQTDRSDMVNNKASNEFILSKQQPSFELQKEIITTNEKTLIADNISNKNEKTLVVDKNNNLENRNLLYLTQKYIETKNKKQSPLKNISIIDSKKIDLPKQNKNILFLTNKNTFKNSYLSKENKLNNNIKNSQIKKLTVDRKNIKNKLFNFITPRVNKSLNNNKIENNEIKSNNDFNTTTNQSPRYFNFDDKNSGEVHLLKNNIIYSSSNRNSLIPPTENNSITSTENNFASTKNLKNEKNALLNENILFPIQKTIQNLKSASTSLHKTSTIDNKALINFSPKNKNLFLKIYQEYGIGKSTTHDDKNTINIENVKKEKNIDANKNLNYDNIDQSIIKNYQEAEKLIHQNTNNKLNKTHLLSKQSNNNILNKKKIVNALLSKSIILNKNAEHANNNSLSTIEKLNTHNLNSNIIDNNNLQEVNNFNQNNSTNKLNLDKKSNTNVNQLTEYKNTSKNIDFDHTFLPSNDVLSEINQKFYSRVVNKLGKTNKNNSSMMKMINIDSSKTTNDSKIVTSKSSFSKTSNALPALRQGGYVKTPTVAYLHENEAVVPLEKSKEFGNFIQEVKDTNNVKIEKNISNSNLDTVDTKMSSMGETNEIMKTLTKVINTLEKTTNETRIQASAPQSEPRPMLSMPDTTQGQNNVGSIYGGSGSMNDFFNKTFKIPEWRTKIG
jgi:hypothetical protein